MAETGLRKKFIEHRGVWMWENSEPDKFPGFKVRDSDIWICSFPRSGTTLVQELSYLVSTLDFESALTKQLDERVTFADINNPELPFYKGLDSLVDRESPRLFKTHFHYFLLPADIHTGKGKVIYVTRNPKSSVPSLYKLLEYLKVSTASSLREFIELFLEDKVYSCPWWLHVRQYWEHRNDANVLFLKYEDIVKNKKVAIQKIATFLGKQLSADDVEKIAEHTSLENMKKNKMVNFSLQEKTWNLEKADSGFINKGLTDGWTDVVPVDLQKRIDAMVQDKLGDTGIPYG